MRSPKNELNPDALIQIKGIVAGCAPECLLDALSDEFGKSDSKYSQIAKLWCLAAVSRIRKEFPGDELTKDFADPNETIGDRAARIFRESFLGVEQSARKSCEKQLAFLIDNTIACKVVENMLS